MGDDILTKVQRAADSAKRELLLIDEQRARVVAELRELEAFLTVYPRYANASPQPERGQLPLAPAAGRRSGTIADIAAEVLRRRGAPMKLMDIIAALRQAGKLGSQSGAYGTAFKSLQMRDDLFEKVSPGVWKLKESPADSPEEAKHSGGHPEPEANGHSANLATNLPEVTRPSRGWG